MNEDYMKMIEEYKKQLIKMKNMSKQSSENTELLQDSQLELTESPKAMETLADVNPQNEIIETPTTDKTDQDQGTLTPAADIPGSESDSPKDDTSFGYIIVETTQANQALPINGAKVTISQGDTLVAFLVTDSDGKTSLIKVPAPPKQNSLESGNTAQFERYSVNIQAEGFYPVRNIPVTVVGESTSIVQQNLVPLADIN